MPKKTFDGGGKRLKNHSRSTCYHSNIFNNLKYFTKELAQFLKPRNEEELSRGAILIEFAVCMPVLIILLFYINDLVKIKRYYSQTEFVGQQMANMIQNISQKRENKKLNKNDFKHITSLAWLTMFPGMTKYAKSLGYVPAMMIAYIKGLDNGNAHCCWRVWSTYENSTTAESDMHWDIGTGSYNFHTVHLYNEASPSSMYPSLRVNSGEYKIVLEVALLTHPTWQNKAGQSTTKQKYGFHLLNPHVNGNSTSFHLCFNSIVIFTPKPGLFTETAPQ